MKIGDTVLYHTTMTVLPMIVTRANDDGTVNGRIFTDSYEEPVWVTNVSQGETPGTWSVS